MRRGLNTIAQVAILNTLGEQQPCRYETACRPINCLVAKGPLSDTRPTPGPHVMNVLMPGPTCWMCNKETYYLSEHTATIERSKHTGTGKRRA